MRKKLEFYEDAGERFEAGMKKLLGPKASKAPKLAYPKRPQSSPK